MPTVFRFGPYRVFFFSNEGDPREPVHVHVEGDGGEAKLWLDPTVTVASSRGFSRQQLAEVATMVAFRRKDIERRWHEHFG